MLQSRLADMDLTVDDTGQNVEPGDIDLAHAGIVPNSHDAAIGDGDIGLDRTGRGVDGATAQDPLWGLVRFVHALALGRETPIAKVM